MKHLLTLTAIVEGGTGIALLGVPSLLAQILLGAPLDASVALTVARVAGAGLLALGIACWLASHDTQSCAARGVVSALAVYNFGAVVVLGGAGIQAPPAGILLWPAVILHAGMAVWCVTSLLSKQANPSS